MKRIIGLFFLVLPLVAQSGRVVVRPKPIDDVLVNPGMGLQSFQRFRQQDFHTGERWEKLTLNDGDQAERADVPQASVAYIRWYWFQIEPEQGKPKWEIVDNALAEARRRGQQLMLRLMPYGGATRQMPEWYQKSGARRANKPEDKDGDIWSPDADDPLYLQHWGALIRAFGRRYDGHPYLDSIDISTVGYWGEGWGPYLPSK
ncbi:MAG: beta-galactosidase, partial [Bryobacterales bacterium]|nr:beta-galactosidase [Bryobacterales bacterium]